MISLVENGDVKRTVSVLGFAPHNTSPIMRGILVSTVTGTRRGCSLSVRGLMMDRTCIGRKPAVGHFHPHTGNSTSPVLGHADRVAVIMSRGGRKWSINRGVRPLKLHINVVHS